MWIYTDFLNALELRFQELGPRSSFSDALDDLDLHRRLRVGNIRGRYHNSADFMTNRRWFHRAWVVQELVLARSVVVRCGFNELEWSRIVRMEDLTLEEGAFWAGRDHMDEWESSRPRLIAGTCQRLQSFRGLIQGRNSVGRLPRDWAKFIANSFGGSGSVQEEELGITAIAIQMARHALATDARDKIFSVLGMIRLLFPDESGENERLIPDYGEANTVERVFLHTTQFMLKRMPHLTLLSYVENATARELRSLPSWVPDYSATLFHVPIPLRGGMFSGQNYNASRCGPTATFPREIHGNVLTLHGARVDSISKICTSTIAELTKQHLFMPGLELCLSLPPMHFSGRSAIDSLWRTMILDSTLDGVHPAPSSLGAAFSNFAMSTLAICLSEFIGQGGTEDDGIRMIQDLLENLRSRATPEEIPQMHEIIRYHQLGTRLRSLNGPEMEAPYLELVSMGRASHEFLQALVGASHSRRLFVTEQGSLGLGHESVAVGDQVWLINDALVPMVLRPTSESARDWGSESPAHRLKDTSSYHTLVGEAYLHGFMHGEFFDGELTRETSFRTLSVI